MATTKITSATTIDISALLKDSKGVALVAGSKAYTSALTKIANFEAAVEANRSASLTIGKDKFSYTKLATSGTTGPAITLKNGTSTFTSATTLSAGTSASTPAPTPAPTTTPTPSPTTTPTVAPTAAPKALTTGADTFSATDLAGSVKISGLFGTLGAGDRIVDGSTTDSDSLSAEVLGNLSDAVTITNIETVDLTILAGTSTVDASNYSGIKTLSMAGSGSLVLNSLGSTDTVLKLNGTGGSLTANYIGTAVAGTADNANVQLSKTTAGTITAGTGVETLTLQTATGESNTVTAVAAGPATLRVTGGGQVTIGSLAANGVPAGVTVVDARDAAKSSLFADGAATTAILLGSGDDSLSYTANLAAGNLIAMGTGTDTLTLVGTTNAAATLTGVENVILATAASSVDLANSATGVALDFQAGGASTVTNAPAGTTLKFSTAGTVANISFAYQGTAAAQALNVGLGRLVTATTGSTFTNVEDLTITASRASSANDLVALAVDATAAGTAVTKKLTLTASAAASSIDTGTVTNAGEVTDLTLNATGASSAIIFGDAATAMGGLVNLKVAAANGGATLVGGITGANKLNTVDIEVGAGNFTATTANDITSANAAGIASIALKATGGNIGSAAGNNAFTVNNSAGGITAVTLSGSENIFAGFVTAGGSKVGTLTSTSTGTTNVAITNNGTTSSAGTVVVLGNAAAGKTNTLTLTSSNKDTVTGGTGVDVISTGDGADVISAGAEADTVTGGAGNDQVTLGNGNDTSIYASRADTLGSLFATTNTTNAEIDRITDFVGNGADAGDVIQFGVTGAGLALGGITFTGTSSAATITAVTVAEANTIGGLATALGTITASTVAASSAVVRDVTVSGGTLAGRYLVLNDDAGIIDFSSDLIINITGITGTLNAADITFVA